MTECYFADAARDYIARGWHVLPLRPRAKEPLTTRGVHDATVDERTILHWGDRWPDANVGIACGGPTGPIVLDVDDLNHPDADAALSLGRRLGAAEVATSRGRHLYFGPDRRQATRAVGYGEIRATGAYVVAPPSLHPSGTTYAWIEEPGASLPRLPEVPGHDRPSAGAGTAPMRTSGLVPAGQRHDFLRDRAARLARSGITDLREVRGILHALYAMSCAQEPAMSDSEIDGVAAWAAGSRIAAREGSRCGDSGRLKTARLARQSGDYWTADHE